jgi:hypothetical protein
MESPIPVWKRSTVEAFVPGRLHPDDAIYKKPRSLA